MYTHPGNTLKHRLKLIWRNKYRIWETLRARVSAAALRTRATTMDEYLAHYITAVMNGLLTGNRVHVGAEHSDAKSVQLVAS